MRIATSTVANQKHPKMVYSNVIVCRLSMAFSFYYFYFYGPIELENPLLLFLLWRYIFRLWTKTCWPSGGQHPALNSIVRESQFPNRSTKKKKWCTEVIVKTKRNQIRFLLFLHCEIVKYVYGVLWAATLCVCIRFQWHILIKRKAKSAFRFQRDYSIGHKSRTNTIEFNCSE